MTSGEKERSYYKMQAGRILVFAGCALMAAVLIINAADLYRSNHAVRQFEAQLNQVNNDEEIVNDDTTQDTEVSKEDTLALLSIDKINLVEAVKEGTESNVISSALGHEKGTALPGEPGNCCIAGHRNYVFGKYFNRLDELEKGDTILISTLEGKFIYTVYDSFVVLPEEVSVLEPTDDCELTLITCTPLFVGSHRLIVKAKMTSQVS